MILPRVSNAKPYPPTTAPPRVHVPGHRAKMQLPDPARDVQLLSKTTPLLSHLSVSYLSLNASTFLYTSVNTLSTETRPLRSPRRCPRSPIPAQPIAAIIVVSLTREYRALPGSHGSAIGLFQPVTAGLPPIDAARLGTHRLVRLNGQIPLFYRFFSATRNDLRWLREQHTVPAAVAAASFENNATPSMEKADHIEDRGI